MIGGGGVQEHGPRIHCLWEERHAEEGQGVSGTAVLAAVMLWRHLASRRGKGGWLGG